MPTAREYRHNAEICLKLACETNEIYGRTALLELATEFRAMAEYWNAKFTRGDSGGLYPRLVNAARPRSRSNKGRRCNSNSRFNEDTRRRTNDGPPSAVPPSLKKNPAGLRG